MRKNLLGNSFFLFTFILLCQTAYAQVKVSGRVLDENWEPLPSATVLEKGTTNGTVTDIDGNYTISVGSSNSVLVFSFIGYASYEQLVGSRSNINASLKLDVAQLEEVVVVGYGTTRKSDLVGAVSQIDSKDIEELPVATFEQALSGQVSGIQLRQTGQPGGGPEILIRGITSVDAQNGPLFVVDGFPLGNTDNQEDNFILSSISPDEIESISVLKDATSKAIYGSRGAGGVIIITTKKGKRGKPKISFNSYFGVQQIPEYEKPDNLNATELAQFLREIEEDDIRVLEGREPTIEDVSEAFRNPEQYGEGTDWFDEITRVAFQQSYNINISGGTDNVQYAVSGSYFDQEGTLINSNFERYNFRANVNAKINDKIRFGVNLAPSHSIRDLSGAVSGAAGFSFFSALAASQWADPTAQVRNPDGTLNTTTQGELLQFFTRSPVAQLTLTQDERRTNQILLSSYLEVEPVKGLVAKSTLNVFYTDRRTTRFTPSNLPGTGNLTPNPLGTGRASARTIDLANFNLINENTLTYTRTIDKDHTVTGLVGFSIEDRESDATELRTNNLLDERITIPRFDNTSQNNIDNFEGSSANFEGQALLSLFARVNYAYKDRYYLTAAFRRDGSSRFGADVRFANFPSVSAAWRISSEPFFVGSGVSSIISDLKIEAGYGITGNNGIPNFGAQGRIRAANYNLGANPQADIGATEILGNFVEDLPASEVTWERTQQLDIGIDIGFLTNKINLGIDLYRTVSQDFLTTLPLPRTTGFPDILDNSGSIENKGIEVEVRTTDLVKVGKFSYDVNANLTVNRNEVLEIDNTLFRGRAANQTEFTITQEGQPVGQYIGLLITGLFTEEEINDPNVPKYAGAQVGSVNYVDADGDGVLEGEEDYVVIGNPLPDYIIGFTHNFRYDNFDLRIVMAGSIGQQIFDLSREFQSNFDGVFNVNREALNRFRPGDDPATRTVPTTVGQTNRWRFPNSASVFDASYLFIRNITLGYNVPKGAFGNFLNSARAYVSIQNPILFTEYDRGNPEVSRVGDNALVRNVDNSQYPISRVYTIGFNLTF